MLIDEMDRLMTDTPNLTYTCIDNDIHWIKIHRSSRQTVEDIFDQLTEIVEFVPRDTPILYLLDSSEVDDLPFRYLAERAKRWEAEQTYLPTVRNAILQSQNMIMLAMVNMMMRLFNNRGDMSRIFPADQRDEAIAWLRANA